MLAAVYVVAGPVAASALHSTLADLQNGRPIRLNTRAKVQPIAHYTAAVIGLLLETLQPGRSAEINSQSPQSRTLCARRAVRLAPSR